MNIRHSKTRGFTLLELMLTIAIISILAVVSYGSYQRYFARANVTDLALRIDSMRTAFAVLEAEEGGIPSFPNISRPGVIQPELSRLALTDDVLQHPKLFMNFHSGYFNQGTTPYLLLVDKRINGIETLTPLSEILSHGQFAWAIEPYLALVPMIGELAVRGDKYLDLQSSTTPAPIPTSSSTTTVTPSP